MSDDATHVLDKRRASPMPVVASLRLRPSDARHPDALDALDVRHGESAGNVARDDAEKSGDETTEVAGQDLEVPSLLLGERQARAVGT